jgi:hypothetical protein
VTFEELHKQYVVEKEEKEKSSEPWSLEITSNPDKSSLYNLLGEIIIKLAQVRSRLD